MSAGTVKKTGLALDQDMMDVHNARMFKQAEGFMGRTPFGEGLPGGSFGFKANPQGNNTKATIGTGGVPPRMPQREQKMIFDRDTNNTLNPKGKTNRDSQALVTTAERQLLPNDHPLAHT